LRLGLIEDKADTILNACPGDVEGVPSISYGPASSPYDLLGGIRYFPMAVQTVDAKGAPIPNVNIEVNLVPADTEGISPYWARKLSSDPDLSRGYDWLINHTSASCTSDKDGNCYLGMAPVGKFVSILAKRNGYIENHIKILFTGGTSIVMVLAESRGHDLP
jgi:hypothetical protein